MTTYGYSATLARGDFDAQHAAHKPMEVLALDALREIEADARPIDASTLDALWNDGICPHCCGMGDTPNWGGCGDRAGGYADVCAACSGTGKDLRGCRECGVAHGVQWCPEIRKELMR